MGVRNPGNPRHHWDPPSLALPASFPGPKAGDDARLPAALVFASAMSKAPELGHRFVCSIANLDPEALV